MKIYDWIKSVKRKSKRTWFLLTAAIVLVVVSIGMLGTRGEDKTAQEDIPYTLARGDMKIEISGNGTVYSADSHMLDPEGFEAEVVSIYFKEGDEVKAGDLLYELESDDLLAQWQSAKINYENKVLEYRMASADVNDLTVRAPVTGVIEELEIEAGGSLASGEAIATIRDKSEVYIKAPFNLAHDGKIKVGQSAEAKFPSSFAEVEGRVEIVESTPASDGQGGLFQYVYVAIDNPGGLLEGEAAHVEIHTASGTVRSITNGLVEYKNPYILESPGSATVKTVVRNRMDKVQAGEIIATLESDALLIDQMNSDISLQEAKLQLDNLTEKMEALAVAAESDGILAGQDVSVGDEVGDTGSENGTNAGNTLGQIISFDKRITIEVDELDVNKVDIGQSAQVTVDAAPGEVFEGEVVKISELGTIQGGVATYDTTVSVPFSKLVKEGMSADVEIVIDRRTDALLLPIEAVMEVEGKKYVKMYDENAKADSKGNLVFIEIGLMDNRFYEVTEGLSEGDIVVLTGLTASDEPEKKMTLMKPGAGAVRKTGGK